ncbi:phenylacetic acid degradation operon negative regulatory protein PaaX [Herbaspirillum sp. HC18]|nr:phenylacetic acid degradation operon negative regulatory protein PaaX [Herbaspirillum sp. HC18]
MRTPSIGKWIEQFLETDPPRAKSVTMTVFGDSIAPHGGAVWLGSLIELLTPFGISDRLVRTSVFRLVEDGWLQARREGRRSLYSLTTAGLRRFEHAYRRIYGPPRQEWNGTWTILFSPPGMIDATERGTLRKELTWEGFRMIAPGVFCRPGGNAEALEDILERTGLSGKMFVCQASDMDRVQGRPLRSLIESTWELDSVVAGYQQFIDEFGPLAKLLDAKRAIEPEQAFVIRTLLTHAFRRVQLHDPLLPLELLPVSWPGAAAYELCRHIYQITHSAAEQYLVTTLLQEDERELPAAPQFFTRFGGLS